MSKFIVRAASTSDLVSLMMNTKDTLARGVVWSVEDITNVGDTNVEEWEVSYELNKGNISKVDDLIMGPEVPTGGMVVIADVDEPTYGFVCGNGSDWYKVALPNYIKEAIIPPKEYGVNLGIGKNRKIRWFDSKEALKSWVMVGLASTEGSESSHYVDMLDQLSDGVNVVNYYT